jgi:hypothetical protein
MIFTSNRLDGNFGNFDLYETTRTRDADDDDNDRSRCFVMAVPPPARG